MHITLNGQPETIEDGLSVALLLQSLDLQPIRVAVEVNRDMVRRANHAETPLHEGDCVEIVTFVGGG